MCIIANAMKRMLCKVVRPMMAAWVWVLRDPARVLQILLMGVAIAIAVFLFLVMFHTAAADFFTQLLATKGKNETIKLIGLGLGGALAAMGTVALNRRATAMMQQNTLIERGHIDERFKAAVQSLGSEQPSARIAAFYQFYHLAKSGSADKDFVKSIFDILCAHLRQITSGHDYRNGEGKAKPTEECQTLLDVLFRNPQDLFTGMTAHLRGVYLVGADLRGAHFINGTNLEKAVLNNADLRGARFWTAMAYKASFLDANVIGASFGYTSMQCANLYAVRQLKHNMFPDPILIRASDEKHYPAWFEEGKHYMLD